MRYRIRNWDNFQHYRDRNPPWIKLHFELLTSRDWVAMDDATRVLAIACMLVASRDNGEIDASASGLAYLHRVAYLNAPPDLQPLIDSGFLVSVGANGADDSAPQADAIAMRQNALPETETEEEIEEEEEEETAKSPDAPPSTPPSPPTERDAPQAPPTASPAAHDEGQLSITALEPQSLDAAPANGTAKRASPAPPPDPLEPYPVLAAYWPDLWQSINAAHPREGPPKPGSQADHKARDVLAKLVRIDGYTEEEVVEVLRWVFGEDDKQAEFWRGVVLSPASLRAAKGGDGVTKFAKIYAQWQRRQPAAIIASHWEGDPDDIF